MRPLVVACLLLVGCVQPAPHELRLEGERTLSDCGREIVEPALCLGLEVIQAEYELCLRQYPGESRCDEVWEGWTRLASPAPAPLPAPSLFQRGFRGDP